eukprot:jgi/Tetstr1/466543/TSEL_011047.t1
MVRPSAGETSQPLLRAFSAQSLVGQSSVLLVAPTGSIAPSDRSANPLRRVSRSCGNLRLVTDGRIGYGDRLMLPAILALVALVAAALCVCFVGPGLYVSRATTAFPRSATANDTAKRSRPASLLLSANVLTATEGSRKAKHQKRPEPIEYEDDDIAIADPDSREKPQRLECRCEAEQPALCAEGIKTSIAMTMCPAAGVLQEQRHTVVCDQKNIDRYFQRTPATKSYRLRDRLAGEPCEGKPNITATVTSRSSLTRIYRQRKTRQSLLEMVPMLAAMPILAPLWNTSREDVFYTRSNMWRLRGWRNNGKPLHAEPFDKETEAYFPAEAPGVLFDSCAVMGNSGSLLWQRKGEEIDGHSAVIRTNQAPTNARVAPFVGRRTDVRVLNRHWSRRYATTSRALLDVEEPGLLLIPSRAATKNINEFGEASRSVHSNKTFLFPTTQMVLASSSLVEHARLAIKLGSGLEYNGGNSPSSGLVSVLLGLQMCKKVDVYGFSLRNCIGKKCPKYHYFNSKEVPDRVRTMSFVGHQYDAEGMIIKALHVLGAVCLMPPPSELGPCGSRFNGLVSTDGSAERLLQPEGIQKLLAEPKASRGAGRRRPGAQRPVRGVGPSRRGLGSRNRSRAARAP